MKKNIFDLSGKVIIVTGGAGLLGKSFSKILNEYGANVVIADVNYDKAQKLADKLGKNAKAFKVDITSKSSIEEFIHYMLDKYNKIDVLINNAYPRNKKYGQKFEEIELDDWKDNIDMHLNGYFAITKLVSEVMIEQKNGDIINLGSIYGIQGPDFSIYKGTDMTSPTEYSAIKGGIINLTRYLASYLGKYNIRVNTLSPGGVFNKQNEDFVKNYEEKTPLKRMATPKDLEGAIVYLASDASNYMTGHNLVVDGGWTIC